MLSNGEAVIGVPTLKVTHLTRMGLHHSPQLDDIPEYKSPFIFQRMWTDHKYFMKVVKEIWATLVIGLPSCRAVTKLRLLKKKLKTWN